MSDDLSRLQEYLTTAEQNLALIRERIAAYVLQEDVPLQLIKNQRALQEYITDLRAQIDAAAVVRAPRQPTTHIVDEWYRGDFVTINEAIRAAQPGDRILVRPGVYQGIVLDKPALEIIGDGNQGQVVIEAREQSVLIFQTTVGRVANLTLRQMRSQKERYAVDIMRGRLLLENCDISSHSSDCIAVHGGANPHLRGNVIHDSAQAGVYIYDSGRGLLEDNKIFGNAYAGVTLASDSSPTIRRNAIYENRQTGVWVTNNGRGLLEDNDIFSNATVGVAISHGSRVTLWRNSINHNAYQAIWIHEDGGGVFEDNDLQDNARGAWNIDADCEKNVERSGNQE